MKKVILLALSLVLSLSLLAGCGESAPDLTEVNNKYNQAADIFYEAAELANSKAGLANTAAQTANTAAGLADTARLAIQSDLALKIESVTYSETEYNEI